MLYDKKVVSILCLSLCFSLHADDCNISNVSSKADKLKSDAMKLQSNATTLQANAAVLKTNANQLKDNATTLKANVAIFKTNATQLEEDYNKLMTLSNNVDLLEHAANDLAKLMSSSSKK